MTPLVLVCGSRSLLDVPGAEARVCAILATLPGAPRILTGGAEGPDQWATAWARRRGLPWSVMRPDGVRLDDGQATRWSPVPVYPLDRNVAMIRVVAEHARSAPALVVGFVDPASRSRGTDHTLRHARAAGLATRRCVLKTWGLVEK